MDLVGRLTIRALKTYYVVNRVHVIVYIAIMAWEALIPYVGICLSACLIDELTNAGNPERLKALVLVTLISAAVIGIVAAILYKIRRIYNDHVTWDNLEHIYAKKMMDMDFGKFDDTKTAEQRSLIRQYQSMGFGISTALHIRRHMQGSTYCHRWNRSYYFSFYQPYIKYKRSICIS